LAVAGTNARQIFHGPVYLIADGLWTLGVAGNIKPRGALARLLVLNEMVVLNYDCNTGFWYEV